MLKLPDGEMWMSMSDAALSQPDTAPSMVATWKPLCTRGREEYLKCLDEDVSQVNSDSAPPACTRNCSWHCSSRGTLGWTTRWLSHTMKWQFSRPWWVQRRDWFSSVNEGGKRGLHSCTIERPAVQNSQANSSRSPNWRTRNLSCTARPRHHQVV